LDLRIIKELRASFTDLRILKGLGDFSIRPRFGVVALGADEENCLTTTSRL
jgi:hypothetical protein